MKTEQKQNQHQ